MGITKVSWLRLPERKLWAGTRFNGADACRCVLGEMGSQTSSVVNLWMESVVVNSTNCLKFAALLSSKMSCQTSLGVLDESLEDSSRRHMCVFQETESTTTRLWLESKNTDACAASASS